jgi:hypothetical protein
MKTITIKRRSSLRAREAVLYMDFLAELRIQDARLSTNSLKESGGVNNEQQMD